jgi:mannitol/fructose-specific phosphotransferase system IIA component
MKLLPFNNSVNVPHLPASSLYWFTLPKMGKRVTMHVIIEGLGWKNSEIIKFFCCISKETNEADTIIYIDN